MEELIQWDWSATLYLNDWGNDLIDSFFNFITHKLSALPLYFILLFALYRKLDRRSFIISLFAVALLITLSDQVANFFKDNVERLRPFREPDFMNQISKVGRSAGTYGFYSGHASNAVALAAFITLILWRHYKKLVGFTIIWALLVAYSRVYLGVHYLGDVLMGVFMGTFWGVVVYYVFAFAKARFRKQPSSP
ncbi:phosphatase PAP2 family protein [Nonlabens spongiae]|uniref:Phosphatase PAP2 family protein n=1 Tax=Nonlabens spongiae TaxID=331648 RepID=A0A1W6MND7_9FLAO|nr:phosphatase PAP2 family protein [Nonlabens spongiae]ARN79124.1 phosphatase PAP2 family protein [Nonlabens spongiae]